MQEWRMPIDYKYIFHDAFNQAIKKAGTMHVMYLQAFLLAFDACPEVVACQFCSSRRHVTQDSPEQVADSK